MSLLTVATELLRALRNRQQVQALTQLDNRTLADIGLLRTDVYASLARPFYTDPSKLLRAACCHWRTYLNRGAPASEPVTCC